MKKLKLDLEMLAVKSFEVTVNAAIEPTASLSTTGIIWTLTTFDPK